MRDVTRLTEVTSGIRHLFTAITTEGNEWAIEQGATHILHLRNTTRAAKVFEHVAYIATDEDAYGKIIWTEWQVRDVRCY